jgi:hypothetical protein
VSLTSANWNHVLPCSERVNLVLELARHVRVPPRNTKEERDAKGDKREILAGRAILEPAAEERESHYLRELIERKPLALVSS